MRHPHRLKKLAPLALLVAGGCHAQIVQFDFTDTLNAQKTVAAGSTINLNPQANMSVLSVAGLDRKLKLSVKNASGTEVFSNTSK